MNRDQIEKTRALLVYMLSDIQYTDEFFSLLFVDVGNNAASMAKGLFKSEDRRVAIFGPRGVGKSAVLQGIAFSGVQEGMLKLPIVAKIGEARSVSTVAELEDRFFTAVAKGIASVPEIHSRWSKRSKKEQLMKYSPWIAKAVTGVAGLFVQPLAPASDVISEAIKSVAKVSNYRSLEELLSSSSIKTPRITDALIKKMREQDIEPIFIIDELDKITDSDAVHNFIEGNQSWFEEKNVVMTMSYNIGESLKQISSASISRIASMKPYMGVADTKEAAQIIYNRATLGYSSIYHDSSREGAQQEVYKLLPESSVAEIIERTFPNPARMLRLTYEVLEEAASKGGTTRDALDSLGSVRRVATTVRVTKQRLRILKTVSTGPMTLTELSLSLSVDSRQLFTTLRLMVVKGLLRTTKEGKRVYYHLTEEGNTVLRLNS